MLQLQKRLQDYNVGACSGILIKMLAHESWLGVERPSHQKDECKCYT